jgi:hypothetical protein
MRLDRRGEDDGDADGDRNTANGFWTGQDGKILTPGADGDVIDVNRLAAASAQLTRLNVVT